ncbi:AMP-binding protein [Rhodobacter sp. CZR27]|uniref:AMP-binding protein n=1 Tax=Rhodobacter sp. CZR27 TaxID=2033869 RepID=UPI000BBE8E5D|nr:AMP-binding protein [Rhodobacter sp. CZR27]
MFYDIERIRSLGSQPCLVWRDECQSYEELAGAMQRFAAQLPRPKALIAVEAAAEPEAIAAYLGAMAAGHAVLPLPAGDPETADRLVSRFRPAMSFRRKAGTWQMEEHQGDRAAPHPDLALLLSTSGSTGQGKGVRLSAAAVHANAASIADFLRITAKDRAALILPLHYSYGLSVLHSHLAQGASLWLSNASVLDEGFGAALAASGATSLAGVPHHFRLLEGAGLGEALPPALKLMTVAGGAMEAAQVRRWAGRMARRGGRFIAMYGQTEAVARIAWLPMERVGDHAGAIGVAIPGGELALRDEQGREIASAVAEGELLYRGPNVMMGYAEDHRDLGRGAEVEALATGDLAQRDAEGIYRITGRLSRMSKIAGIRIGHDALERALAAEGVEVAIWGDDRRIVVAARGPGRGLADRAARAAGIGPGHFEIVPCEVFPRLPSGKIDYPALRSLAERRSAPGVRAAFEAVFAPEPVRAQDSFTSLGGDSLRHVELTLALEAELGGLPEGWERMSLAELERAPLAPSGVESELAVRGLAILAVVVAHQTLWPVYGGAAAMVLLLGMSLAGSRWEALTGGDWKSYFRPLAGVLVPYYLVLAGFAAAWGQVPWASALLAGNLALTVPETHLMLPYLYWFVEAYVQISLLIALPFLHPGLRGWLRRAGRFRVGLGLLALGVGLRLTLPELWPMGGRAQFTLPWVFYLLGLGWCIASAEGRGRKAGVLALAAGVLPMAAWLGGNWHGSWIKYMSLFALVPLLLYVPRIAMPRPAARAVMLVARAAFPIYLLHRLVPEVILPAIGLGGAGAWTDALAVVGGIGIGLAVADLRGRVLLRHRPMRGAEPLAAS